MNDMMYKIADKKTINKIIIKEFAQYQEMVFEN